MVNSELSVTGLEKIMKQEDLEVWKKSIDLVTKIYDITKLYPQSENFGLRNQMQRCAISIPSNIAEGCARFSDKETLNFISIAIGSLAELQTQLIISKNLGYIKSYDNIMEECNEIKRMLIGLSKYLKNK